MYAKIIAAIKEEFGFHCISNLNSCFNELLDGCNGLHLTASTSEAIINLQVDGATGKAEGFIASAESYCAGAHHIN